MIEADSRERQIAVYMIETGGTVRSAALRFGISKSTVHKDLSEKLPDTDPALFVQIRQLLDRNKSERHIRGGMATKAKFHGK